MKTKTIKILITIIIALFSDVLFFYSNQLSGQDPLGYKSEVEEIGRLNIRKMNTPDLILFTGSSSIKMWKNVQDYFPGKNTVNTGFGGSQMSDLVFYFDSLILKYHPVQVLIYEGDNDIAKGKKAEEVFNDASLLLERFKKDLPKTKIVFIAVKPSIARWKLKDEQIRYNNMLKTLSSKNSNIQFINTWDFFLDEKGMPKKELFIEDGLHMSKPGYDIWAKEIKKIIR
jgi:lysophospholipase L1-like esterase